MKRLRPPTPPNARRQYNPGPDDREDIQPGELITRHLTRPPMVRSTAPPPRGPRGAHPYERYGASRHARFPPNPHRYAYQPPPVTHSAPIPGLVCCQSPVMRIVLTAKHRNMQEVQLEYSLTGQLRRTLHQDQWPALLLLAIYNQSSALSPLHTTFLTLLKDRELVTPFWFLETRSSS